MAKNEQETGSKPLPPPWDRIFSLGSRLFVWGLLFGILYILRPFFLLVFLTFVFAYILEHGVQGLRHRIGNRPVRVVLVAVVFLGTLITAGFALAPSFTKQASTLAGNYTSYLESIDKEIGETRDTYPWTKSFLPEDARAADVIEYLLGIVQPPDETAANGDTSPGVAPRHMPGIGDATDGPGGSLPDEGGPGAGTDPTPKPPVVIVPSGPMTAGATEPRPRAASKERLAEALETLSNIASPVFSIGSAFLLSLLFSFLIVLDLPKLRRGVQGLANTKIGFIYDEVAENVRDFGKMLGRALEAQLFIAACNTILTAIGLYFLGLTNNLVFLSTIVFFCSFIPVAGVFLSSTPICLEALSQSGVQLMLLAIGLILIIHFIEAYFLNPKIFGHHLHMNAVLVLIVLTIAGKLFGVWGLVLGLPVVNYVFGHAIRYGRREPSHPKSAAA